MPSIVPNLWFDTQAEEAAEFYCSVFPNAGSCGPRTTRGRPGAGRHGPDGGVRARRPAFSASTAARTSPSRGGLVPDRLRGPGGGRPLLGRAHASGGEESQCGWLKDRYGLSWQVVPDRLASSILDDPDPERGPARDAGDARHEEARPRRAAGRRRRGVRLADDDEALRGRAAARSAGRGARPADRDRTERLPRRVEVEHLAHHVGAEQRAADPRAAQALGGQLHQQVLHRRRRRRRRTSAPRPRPAARRGSRARRRAPGTARRGTARAAARRRGAGAARRRPRRSRRPAGPAAHRAAIASSSAVARCSTRTKRHGVVWCGAGAVTRGGDGPQDRGPVDRPVGERPHRAAQRRRLTAAPRPCRGGTSPAAAGRTRASAPRPSSGSVEPADDGHRDAVGLALDQLGGRRELVGHGDLGDLEDGAEGCRCVPRASRTGASPATPMARSTWPIRQAGPWCRRRRRRPGDR